MSAREEDGFTVIELFVSMFITGLMFAVFGLLISSAMSHSALIANQGVAAAEARTALAQFTRDIREANIDTTGATCPFLTCTGTMSSSTITFWAPDGSYDPANPANYHLREIGYQFTGTTFQRASSDSTNTNGPPWTVPALPTFTTLINNVVAASFTYLDGSQPPQPTTSPPAVRTVVVSVTVSLPGSIEQETFSDSASIRETAPTS